MEMTSYFIRRFLLIIPTFVGITLLVFAVTRLVPGGPIERALNEALQSSFKVVRVIMVILAIAFLGSGITKIDNNKRALHLRFGEYIATLNPGLVWAWPYPIDELVQIPVNENRTITSDVGWRTEDEESPQPSMSFHPPYYVYTPVSYTPLTLPTHAYVSISLVSVSLHNQPQTRQRITPHLRTSHPHLRH